MVSEFYSVPRGAHWDSPKGAQLLFQGFAVFPEGHASHKPSENIAPLTSYHSFCGFARGHSGIGTTSVLRDNFHVYPVGFRVWGSGFRSLALRVEGLGLGVLLPCDAVLVARRLLMPWGGKSSSGAALPLSNPSRTSIFAVLFLYVVVSWFRKLLGLYFWQSPKKAASPSSPFR